MQVFKELLDRFDHPGDHPGDIWDSKIVRKVITDKTILWILSLANWKAFLTLTFEDDTPYDIAIAKFKRLVRYLNKLAKSSKFLSPQQATGYLMKNKVGLPERSPHKFRHGHIHYGQSHSKTQEDYKAISQNVMHSTTGITDKFYSNMDDDMKKNLIDSMFV